MRSDQGSDASAMTRLNDPMPAEQIQRLLHDNLGATVSIMDAAFTLRYVNTGFAQAFDLPAQALIGRNVKEFYSESDFAEFSPHLQRAFAGETVAYERVGRLRNRHAIWRAVSLVPWRDETDGRVLGVVMSSLPVHELMVATDSLRAANARLSSHMDNSPLTVFELDGALNVTRVSSRVRQLLGLDPSAVVGRGLWEVLPDDAAGGSKEGLSNDNLKAAFSRLRAGLETSNRVLSVHRRANG